MENQKKKPDDSDVKKVNKVTEAYKRLARTEDGQIVLADLFDQCALLSNGFTGNSTTFFNLGRREVGLHIIRRLTGEHGVPAGAFSSFLEILIK